MMVMITMTAARVKPCCDRALPALVRCAIESIAGGLAVYVVDAGGGVVGRCRRIGGDGGWIGGIGSVLHFLPVGLAGHRILGDLAEIVLLLKGLQALGILLLIGVVVVDRFAHLEQVVAQRRFTRFGLSPFDVGNRHGREDADDRDDDDQLDQGEAGLL